MSEHKTQKVSRGLQSARTPHDRADGDSHRNRISFLGGLATRNAAPRTYLIGSATMMSASCRRSRTQELHRHLA